MEFGIVQSTKETIVPAGTSLFDLAGIIEGWNEGWRRNADSETHVHLTRSTDGDIEDEIEMRLAENAFHVFARRRVRMSDGRWETVSIPVRNQHVRRAVTFVNEAIDFLDDFGCCSGLPSKYWTDVWGEEA